MLRCVKAGPDGADHLAVDDNWQTALHFSEAARRNGGKATVVDRIFERLTRLLEQRSVRVLPGASSTLAR
jgi:hypothetical protein